MGSYVERRRVTVERAYVEDDEGLLDTAAAIALAKREGFEAVRDEVTYNVHIDGPDGCRVSQMTGRPEVETRKRKGAKRGTTG